MSEKCEPMRILHVFASLDRGGAETLIMNVYRKIDREKFQFDFIVNDRTKEYAFEAEVLSMGGRVFRMPRYLMYNMFSYKRAWEELLKAHPEWRIIHGHHLSPAFIYFKVAKKMGLKTIAHSHCAGGAKNFKELIRKPFRYLFRKHTDVFLACSVAAAEFIFGGSAHKSMVVNNAIDMDIFGFDSALRESAQDEFGIKNQLVVGHVSNFSAVKNQSFLIDVFAEIRKIKPDAVLLLVGNGAMRGDIEEKVKRLNLSENVIFAGVRGDVANLMQAMDVFILPSFFEGLPTVCIEAQATGLPCLISDKITAETKITDSLSFMPLEEDVKNWAKTAVKISELPRLDGITQVKSAGYDIVDVVKQLEQVWRSA